MTLAALPIDDALPALLNAIRDHGVAVLVAPPGAGKTTRVPAALLDAGLLGDGDVVVLQPRRLAARLAAARVASERGVQLGQQVGYEIRLDRKVSESTKIRFVTEGILTRRLLTDRRLAGTSCIIIDEFHERHLDGDVALAMVANLRQTRPELQLIVMSATLDATPVAAFLGAPIVRSEGRTFPIEIEHADPRDQANNEGPEGMRLGKQVAAAVRKLMREGCDGDILVFLPGAHEIRLCTEDVAQAAATFDLLVVPLHGDLTADEQDHAVQRSAKRKVILATNVAETSVTIDGVVAVIDSGKARIAKHSPWSGLPTLQIEPVSKASATQRAGRAGRTRPGKVVRLYTKHDYDGRREFDAPEIARADLANVALDLKSAGISAMTDLPWFEAPPATAVQAAETLLAKLGATTSDGSLTPLGKRMAKFGAHPRLARIVCEGDDRSVGKEACLIAALASAKELRLERRTFRRNAGPSMASPSDLIDDLDAMLDARASGMRADALRANGLDVATAMQVHRLAQQYERGLVGKPSRHLDDTALDTALQLAILAGYPDRVGKRRAARSADFVFAAGGSGTLAPTSSVVDAEYIVAVDIAETGQRGAATKVQIRRASAIDPAWLIELFADQIVERDELVWNADRKRVEGVSAMAYDGLVIDEQRSVERARQQSQAAATLLAHAALAAGIEQFVDGDALRAWRARLATVAKALGDPSIVPNDANLEHIIGAACDGLISFDELRKADVMTLIEHSLGDLQHKLAKLAPTHLDLPRRRRVAIHYEQDQNPWIASRMQDFFGLAKAPSVCDGRVPLVLHLLAPNQRPVQVTQDLPGFWKNHYPGLRNQLQRRYPRHQWPEDPSVFIASDD